MFVEVDPNEHAEDAEDVDFNAEAQCEFYQNQINGEGRADTGSKVCREDALNRALGCHDVENFSKNSAK